MTSTGIHLWENPNLPLINWNWRQSPWLSCTFTQQQKIIRRTNDDIWCDSRYPGLMAVTKGSLPLDRLTCPPSVTASGVFIQSHLCRIHHHDNYTTAILFESYSINDTIKVELNPRKNSLELFVAMMSECPMSVGAAKNDFKRRS